ncbi:hypothetical protein FRC09_004972 [Ceratobasidium sp. 395]|nr:hypothetical protein FRC09_004972 [Ceratobasidium sp. 395]
MVHEELLKVLGQLPHLETLSLCTDNMEEWEYDESPLAVSDDSFPSLRHLYLYGLDESAMSRVCKVPPLFHHLVKDNGRSDVAVTCLGQNSPHVEELTILPRGDNGLFFISRPTLDKFKRMPLRYLRLGDFIFSGGYEESDDEGDEGANNPSDRFESHQRGESHWKNLLSSVPQLEELHLERKPLDPQLLQLIALGLPNLRLLVFGDLDLKKVKSSGKANPVAAQPITLRGYSYFWCQKLFNRNLPSEEHIYNAAKFVARPTN